MTKATLRKLSSVLCLALFLSCDSKGVFDQYENMSDAWPIEDTAIFTFSQPTTSESYDLFVNVRNDNSYPFSNLFLLVEMNFPEGKAIADTLEYEMARPNGEWLGKGFTDIKESKLWYKEGVRFPEEGTYQVHISHLMRKNGAVEGVKDLPGITDVGFRIERNEH